jgi:nucleoside-diphosphate-sugar epimerase
VTAPLAGRTILVTGSTGFIGRPLCRALADAGAAVRAAVRRPGGPPTQGIEPVLVPDLLDRAALRHAAQGADTIVHLAARVHVMSDAAPDPLAEHRSTNVAGTEAVLDAASAAGVGRFLFTSTVKAVGEATEVPWNEDVPPAPSDPYGRSKLEAEEAIRARASLAGFDATILRLPLVYGPDVKGNMQRLFALVDRGVPLPFRAVANRRSLLYVGNLSAAVVAVLRAGPTPAAGTFFVTEGEGVSLPILVRAIGEALECPARLIPVPPSLLRLAGQVGDVLAPLIGHAPTSAEIGRLVDSLVVDGSRLAERTGYVPPFTMAQGLRATAAAFRAGRSAA